MQRTETREQEFPDEISRKTNNLFVKQIFFCIFAPMRLRIIICSIFYVCTLPMWGVDILSRKLTTMSGLPDNNVRSLIQDSRGFIWMGTQGGLYRYDGYFFTSYKSSDAGNGGQLNNNHIIGLYDAGGDRLMIAQQGNHYSVYDTRQDKFLEMSEVEKQQLYAKCRKGQVSPQVQESYSHIINNGGGVINDNLGNYIVLDNTGQIWYIDRHTGETLRMRVFDASLFPLVSSKKYKVLTSPKKGLIWVSTNGCGITVYDRHTRTEQHVRQSSGLISTDYIIDMCLDQDENVWVADEFHGVAYLSTIEDRPEQRMLASGSHGFHGNQVYIMKTLPDSTILIANTQGDVYKADQWLNIEKQPAYQGLDVHSVCTDRHGDIWIGSRQHGLMSGRRKWYKHDPGNPNSISSDNIYSLFCDRDGRIWVACEDSYLDLAVPLQDGTYAFRHFFDKRFSARVLYGGADGFIWVGTKNGLYGFRPDELLRDTSAYIHPLTGADLNYSDVSCIYQDSRGTLWVGTIGSGVYSADAEDRHFTRKSSLNLISYDVQSIVESRNGLMWFATKNGLTSFQPLTGQTQQHYSEDIPSNYYADNCVCTLPDGRIAFGTNAGIQIYNPTDVDKGSPQNQRLSITGILVNGVLREITDRLELAHDENSLTVRFSSFNYRDVAGIRYTYKLDGYDSEWSEASPYSFASYKKLSPGHYTLRIKAYEPGKDECERTIDIIVNRPWWRSLWAYMVYMLLAALVGYVVYRQLQTVYRLEQRIAVEKQLTEYKLRFFTNISHEFRTPLTIIQGAMERMKAYPAIPAEMRQPVSNMDRSVGRMLRLVNQLLEFRKMQNDKLKLALEETDIVKQVRDIFQTFRDIADNKHITYNLFTQEKSRVMPVDTAHLDKIVYNILSNAFKYTPSNGEIKLRLSFPANKVQISVEDTGVGIPPEKQPELFQRFMQSTFSNNSIGIGLNLTKALVEVHHGRIWYQPNIPKGSIFTVELPADSSDYSPGDFLATGHQQLKDDENTQSEIYKELAAEPMNDRAILIVEDDSDVLDYLRSLLQRYFVVHTAMDGVEALQVVETLRPSLIISDIMMPVMDGLELTSHIRADNLVKDTPVILLTALTDDEKRIKGIENGADAYITKPFQPQLLVKTAVSLISQRDMLKGRYAQHVETATKAELPELIVDERDKKLLNAINHWLSTHLSDPTLSVDTLAEAMGYRRTVFYKKVKALTGMTPADYIKTQRMNHAAELLKDDTVTVAEVCYKVGISDPHYFAKIFKQQFGISPKKYQQGEKQ